MKSDSTKVNLESIQFLFRHPWLFIYPFVIIISAFYGAISSTTTLKYQCSSILSLDTIGGTVIDSRFIEEKSDLIGRVLLGDNIRNIIKTVWPNMDENADPNAYNGMMGSLRSSKGGIQMEYDRKDPRLLMISYIDRNPELCYKVVRATIDTIEKANKQTSAKELETGMDFLRKQVEFYRMRLKDVDAEVSKTKSELKEKSLGLSDKERDLVEEILGGSMEGKNVVAPGFSAASQKAVKYEEMSADLNLQLLETERKKEDIEKQLKTGVFSKQSQGTQSIEDDAFVKEYSHAIASKELAMANLLSQGYTSEHPHVVRLHKEIGELESLKARRMEELITPVSAESSEGVKRQQEEAAKVALRNIDFQIETLKDKINLMEKYKKGTAGQETGIQRTDVSALAAKLTELRGEKEISMMYYTDLRRELEAAEIKRRLQKEEIFHIRIIEEPKIPLDPIPFQTMPKLFMGLIIAVVAGGGLAYAVDSLDNSVKSSSELRELLQIPVLASIDKINTPQEIKAKRAQRRISIVSLIVLTVFANFLARMGLLRFLLKQ